jgi:hypothetical protein
MRKIKFLAPFFLFVALYIVVFVLKKIAGSKESDKKNGPVELEKTDADDLNNQESTAVYIKPRK